MTLLQDEKFKATQYVQKIKAERLGKATLEVLEEEEVGEDHVIFSHLKEGKSKRVSLTRKASMELFWSMKFEMRCAPKCPRDLKSFVILKVFILNSLVLLLLQGKIEC